MRFVRNEKSSGQALLWSYIVKEKLEIGWKFLILAEDTLAEGVLGSGLTPSWYQTRSGFLPGFLDFGDRLSSNNDLFFARSQTMQSHAHYDDQDAEE